MNSQVSLNYTMLIRTQKMAWAICFLLLFIHTDIMANGDYNWEKINDWANYINIGLGVLVVLSTIWVFYSGAKAQEVVKAQFEAKTQTARAEAAKANQQAEAAKAESAKANQATSEIKQTNIKLESDLNKTVADAAVEKQKLAKMEIEVASAKEKQANAERELLELQERLQPRSLTVKQKEQFLQLLSKEQKANINIGFPPGNAEADHFAKDIASVFHMAGWEVELSPTINMGTYPGLTIWVHDEKTAPISAGAVQKILKKMGFGDRAVTSEHHPAGRLHLFVGPKE